MRFWCITHTQLSVIIYKYAIRMYICIEFILTKVHVYRATTMQRKVGHSRSFWTMSSFLDYNNVCYFSHDWILLILVNVHLTRNLLFIKHQTAIAHGVSGTPITRGLVMYTHSSQGT